MREGLRRETGVITFRADGDGEGRKEGGKEGGGRRETGSGLSTFIPPSDAASRNSGLPFPLLTPLDRKKKN